ncbi:14920_t:CDS:2 [Acaulospora morrowiae]|uniref:histidine kinase n=1 Tax=Acaulospora morrowiae TaxID=94023 RepID=A0A9N8WLJ3_9GLOM|nr:14920_t:CDS:2 [Acaulospora morrowiae]
MSVLDSFFATILDNAAPTLVTDLRGRIVYVNKPTLCLLEGYHAPKKSSAYNVKDLPETSYYIGDHYNKLLEPLDSHEAKSFQNHFTSNAQIKKGTEVRRVFKCRTFKNKRPIILELSTRTCVLPKNLSPNNVMSNLRQPKSNVSECRCEHIVDVNSVKEKKDNQVSNVRKVVGGEEEEDEEDGDEQFYDASEDSEEDISVLSSHVYFSERQETYRDHVIVKGEKEPHHKGKLTGNSDSTEYTAPPNANSPEDRHSTLHAQKDQVLVVMDPCLPADPTKNTVFISTIRDVTDSNFADFVLSEAENRITLTYDVTGIIHEVSRSCKHILGFEPNELLGLDGYSYIHPDDATEVRMYHSKRVSEPYGTTLQRNCFRHQRKDGSYCLLEIWSQGIQPNGRWTFVGFDVTNTTECVMENRGLIPDQAIIRRRLLHNTDEDSQKKFANNFVSFICHEFLELRNPLNGIIGYTTFLLDTELTKQQRDYAEAISSISNHMCNTINQSLDLCQTQSHGTYISEIGPLHLSEVVKFCFLTVTVLARSKGIELRMRDNITPFLKSRVQGVDKNFNVNEIDFGWYGDEDTIRKILLNYLTNAIKHTGSGSVTVVLDVEDDKLPDNKEGFMAKCSVEDTGPGIPQKNLKRLFLPYSKLVSSFGEINKDYDFVDGVHRHQQDQPQRSSGLGLSICKELADKMGGKVGVESTLGNGSKFWFTFPIYTSVPEGFDDENDPETVVSNVSDNEFADKEKALKDSLWKKAYSLSSDVVNSCEPCASNGGQKKLLKRRSPTNGSISSIRSLSSNLSSSSRTDPELSDNGGSHKFGSLRKNKKPAKVLMVEDNEVNQQVAIKYLEKMGEEVTVAANGVEALEKMKNESFDILFVDLQMPLMDGYTLTRRIREAEREPGQCEISLIPSDVNPISLPCDNTSSCLPSFSIPTIRRSPTYHHRKHLPIVACTGSVLDREKDKCRQYGMDGFLTKPYRLEEMRLCIEELVDANDESGVD